jgi:hypothetical protein
LDEPSRDVETDLVSALDYGLPWGGGAPNDRSDFPEQCSADEDELDSGSRTRTTAGTDWTPCKEAIYECSDRSPG